MMIEFYQTKYGIKMIHVEQFEKKNSYFFKFVSISSILHKNIGWKYHITPHRWHPVFQTKTEWMNEKPNERKNELES